MSALTDAAALCARGVRVRASCACSKFHTCDKHAIPPELSPFKGMPVSLGLDGRPECHWCGSKGKLNACGLCAPCFREYVCHRMHKCVACGEPAVFALRGGLCAPCRGKGEKAPENLEELVKQRWVGMIK